MKKGRKISPLLCCAVFLGYSSTVTVLMKATDTKTLFLSLSTQKPVHCEVGRAFILQLKILLSRKTISINFPSSMFATSFPCIFKLICAGYIIAKFNILSIDGATPTN